jgi:tyrosyl-tRNA synthetase
MYKLATLTSFERAQHAASELVKFDSGAKLSGFLYPILQTLDEEYLECDMQYGGLDQRKVFGFARESHPKIGQRKRIGVMTPMLPGIMGGKMSSSDPSSKIDLLDSSDDIETKLNKAFCPEGVVENNGIMAFMKYVIMVLKGDKGEKFAVGRDEKFGGNVEYSNYEELEKDFVAKKLHPADLKKALARELAEILKPVREAFKNKQDLIKEAYPEK